MLKNKAYIQKGEKIPNTELEIFKIKMKICKLEILQDINAVKVDKIAGLVEMNFNCRGL